MEILELNHPPYSIITRTNLNNVSSFVIKSLNDEDETKKFIIETNFHHGEDNVFYVLHNDYTNEKRVFLPTTINPSSLSPLDILLFIKEIKKNNSITPCERYTGVINDKLFVVEI